MYVLNMGHNQKRNKYSSRKNSRNRRKTTENSWFGEERRIILEGKMSDCNQTISKKPDKMNKDIRKKETKHIKHLDKKGSIV